MLRVIRWEETGFMREPDPTHAEIMIEQMGLKGARSLKIPGVKEEKNIDRELRVVIDHIIDVNNNPDDNNIVETNDFRRSLIIGESRRTAEAK